MLDYPTRDRFNVSLFQRENSVLVYSGLQRTLSLAPKGRLWNSVSTKSKNRFVKRSSGSRRTNRPRRRRVRRGEKYPHDVVDKAAEMGLVGSSIPSSTAVRATRPVESILIAEELFSYDPGSHSRSSRARSEPRAIEEFGTEDQKERFLEPVALGEKISGAAISEPDTGSDVSSVSTRAEKDGDEWVINGNKMWITNGSIGDFFVVLCKTNPDAEGRYNGFSQIVVESDRDGFSADKITG
ncbi:acyl-CoA dehydrogenase family protein [Natrarchaeobaculum aegyptiacum]|uniref:acyl-CoA dehydrogenase family protein n=1 Tax=Natrarchaeobaculum aegyptiacum TaxID=745377 RepID=UPI001E282AA2|nr:acyl-CoA dehydrogenase family protein [Natrarchaeobaculum aegyptiacum]